MTVENRYQNYRFSDMREMVDDEDDIEDALLNGEAVGTIFMDDGGVGGEVADLLAARVAHMTNSVEDQQEYAKLRDDLETHIFENY